MVAETAITQLGNRVLRTAMDAAAEYLTAHNLTADSDALAGCLSAWVKAKLPEALHDAREAFDAGMHQVGELAFLAPIAQAGIEAAKEAGFPARGLGFRN